MDTFMFLFQSIPILIVLFFCFALGLYFLPTILAIHKRNLFLIFLINLFFGWTFIGWIVGLVLAVTSEANRPIPSEKEYPKQCPYCAETIKQAAIICRFCQRDLVPKAQEEVAPEPEVTEEPETEPEIKTTIDKDDPNRWNPAYRKDAD